MSEVTDVYFDSEDDDEVFDESTSVEVEDEDPTKPRDLEGCRVINLGDPVDHQDAATKLYVDNQFTNAREFTNYTSKEQIKRLDEMRSDLRNLSAKQTHYLRQWQNPGPFNADLFRISNVGNPEEDRDATPRTYVYCKVKELKKEVDKLPPIEQARQREHAKIAPGQRGPSPQKGRRSNETIRRRQHEPLYTQCLAAR
ncbi:hypothetical protein R5R35_004141 [Gryllus longicercus]|uniref:Uncharacterized protein n=1 Tax=Gryllus longicercus TaxID=2509291 RepID=A0AAN9Z3F3_9ORTH